ncbi:MAG: SDR family NAD(P)-dependent oxidoreductase, partial [Thermomicrobiales bacterium]
MSDRHESDSPLAVVCGSHTHIGGALVTRLRDTGWEVFTIDPPGAASHAAAAASMHGELWEAAPWSDLAARVRARGKAPRAFVHALSDFDTVAVPEFGQIVRSAELGWQHVLPLLTDAGAMVFVASVLAGWDSREDAAFAASQAGLLALMRSLALIGAPNGVRVNAVCTGLAAERSEAVPAEIRGRIPLGRPASPDDIADAVLFFLSPDAGHVTGSTLVVDGGQSLQSWSNAPQRTLTPSPSPIAMGEGGTRMARRFQDRTVLIT